MDYIDVFKYFVIIGVLAVIVKKVWDMITEKRKKKTKWEDYLED